MSKTLVAFFPVADRLIELHKITDFNYEVRVILFTKKETIRTYSDGRVVKTPKGARLEPSDRVWGRLGYTYRDLGRSVAKASELFAKYETMYG